VFACPDVEALGSFYARLLGMEVVRTDWFVIAADRHSSPRLAFDEDRDFRPPRPRDPERPQQLRLEIRVTSLEAAEKVVRELGATKLQQDVGYRTYADPAGHPFCLYEEAGIALPDSAVGRIGRIVYDCFSPRSLAWFYSQLLGLPDRKEDSERRVVISNGDDSQPDLGFQHAQFQPARWPDPNYPQQIHLDFHVDDGEKAQALALQLGAIPLAPQGGSCPVFADPAAHPFCLCSPGQ
jgi:catechol 2,3-dioxygenase-like lactoylglutathione lyase family enzyme